MNSRKNPLVIAVRNAEGSRVFLKDFIEPGQAVQWTYELEDAVQFFYLTDAERAFEYVLKGVDPEMTPQLLEIRMVPMLKELNQ